MLLGVSLRQPCRFGFITRRFENKFVGLKWSLVLSKASDFGIYFRENLYFGYVREGLVLRRLINLLIVVGVAISAEHVFASGGLVNWYDVAYQGYAGEGYNAHMLERIVPVCGALFVLVVTLLLGLAFKASLNKAGSDVTPDGKFSVRTVVEMAMDLVYSIAKDNIGEQWRTFVPLLAGVFMFIVIANLGGLVPGFVPATESINTNLAMGLMIFLVYNFAGFKEHKHHYLKQFAGPMLAIAPLMFTIELISHLFRPVSLSLRLMGNIFADHLMLGIFTSTWPHFVIPSALMFFGLLVSLVQSFVFTLLTGIYISLAVSHDH